MQSMANKLTGFYESITPPIGLPPGIELLFPQKDKQVRELTKKFFHKYFDDHKQRSLMLGINPGRFGAGITGVNFTAPKQLKHACGIDHHFKLSSELSAEFIYDMIAEYGGPEKFYQDWFIGAVCPLGFVSKTSPGPSKGGEGTPSISRSSARKDATDKTPTGKNINYYDDKKLLEAVTPFIVDCINKQMAMGFNRERCLCIGGEKNFKFLSGLNNEYKWFSEIVPLPHPRFILQYRRKQKDKYIHQYLSALRFAG
jgi:hypothetical protein